MQPWSSQGLVETTLSRSAFREFLDLKLFELSTARIDRWRALRRSHHPKAKSREVSRSTINHNTSALRAALARAVEWGMLSAMSLGKLKRRKEDDNAIVRCLSVEEEERLRAALGARDTVRRASRESANVWRRERGYEEWAEYGVYTDHLTPLVLTAANTGLRRGELLQLRWRDVNLEQPMLTVRGEGAKTGQTRHVPLNSEALSVLNAWKPTPDGDSNSCVFGPTESSTPIVAIRRTWTTVLKAAAVSSFRFHDLRHTFASKLVRAGVDLIQFANCLGTNQLR